MIWGTARPAEPTSSLGRQAARATPTKRACGNPASVSTWNTSEKVSAAADKWQGGATWVWRTPCPPPPARTYATNHCWPTNLCTMLPRPHRPHVIIRRLQCRQGSLTYYGEVSTQGPASSLDIHSLGGWRSATVCHDHLCYMAPLLTDSECCRCISHTTSEAMCCTHRCAFSDRHIFLRNTPNKPISDVMSRHGQLRPRCHGRFSVISTLQPALV